MPAEAWLPWPVRAARKTSRTRVDGLAGVQPVADQEAAAVVHERNKVDAAVLALEHEGEQAGPKKRVPLQAVRYAATLLFCLLDHGNIPERDCPVRGRRSQRLAIGAVHGRTGALEAGSFLARPHVP